MTNRELQDRADALLSSQETLNGRLLELLIGVLIIAASGLFVWETMVQDGALRDTLLMVERLITVVFLIEYLARWWAKRFSIRYLFTPLALVDLLAVLPLFFAAPHLQAIRVLRLLRVVRLVRLLRSRKFFFGEITDIHLLVARMLLTIFCLVFITGGLVYDLENQPGSGFVTIFDGFYFALVTLTTVGFGDLIPLTWEGRIVTMIMILTGVMVIPFQLTGLARRIVLDSTHRAVTCSSCGLQFHERDASHCKACGSLVYQEYDGS